MEFLGESAGYMIYKNSDGFIEGYKKTGKQVVNGQNIGKNLGHIVTNCKTQDEFAELMAANSLKPPDIKPGKLPELPFE